MSINKRKAFSIALLITFANILGKTLGFIRDILISYYYGASELTDAIFLAMSIPLLILGVFTSSTDSAIIPQYNRISKSMGKCAADEYFSSVVNIILCIAFVISMIILIYPSIIISIFAPGFNMLQKEYAIHFLRIFSFFGFMHIFYCFFSTYNTIYAKVLPRAILSFTTNLLVVVALLIYPDPDMLMLSTAYLIGNILSAVIPIISALKNGYKHNIGIRYNEEVKKFAVIFFPIMGNALLSSLNIFVDKFIASSMETGSISYINYASRLTNIFDSVLVVGLGVIILPLLSESRSNNDFIKFKRDASQVIKLLSIILFPLMILCMMLSNQIVEVIYMRGKFSIEAAGVVAIIFFCYAPQILFLPIQATLAKIFHAIEDTRSPFYINAFSVGINIILSIIFSFILGIKGIAIATSFSVIIAVLMLVNTIKKEIGWDTSIFNLKELFKIFICGTVSLISAHISINFVNSSLEEIFIAFIIGGLTYIVMFAVLLKNDFRYLLSLVYKRK